MPAWDSNKIHDIEYISTGYSNRNYAFTYDRNSFIFRLPQGTQPFVDYQHELEWFRQLPNSSLFTKPIAFDSKTGCMISRKIEGVLLADLFDASWDRTLLIDYVQQLHDLLPICGRDYPLKSLLEEYGMKPSKGETLFAETFVASHNDLNPWNIIVTENDWVTIDWEFAGNNDPLFDLITLHQGLTLPMEELFELCPQYDARCTLKRIKRNLADYWLRECGWAKYQISQGNDRQEIIDQFEDSQKILKSL